MLVVVVVVMVMVMVADVHKFFILFIPSFCEPYRTSILFLSLHTLHTPPHLSTPLHPLQTSQLLSIPLHTSQLLSTPLHTSPYPSPHLSTSTPFTYEHAGLSSSPLIICTAYTPLRSVPTTVSWSSSRQRPRDGYGVWSCSAR